jgi:hypothetical protein
MHSKILYDENKELDLEKLGKLKNPFTNEYRNDCWRIWEVFKYRYDFY